MQEKNSINHIAKSFSYLAWILALAGLTLIFSKILDRQENPNQNLDTNQTAQYKEVTLKDNRANHYVFTGKINNIDVVFLVDTGATDVALSEQLAKKLNLRKGLAGLASTANGITQTFQTKITRLEIGQIILKDVDASIVTGMDSQDSVLLGMSALKDLEMIHKNGELTIRQYY